MGLEEDRASKGMEGVMIIIPPDAGKIVRKDLVKPPALEELKEAVGGYIELIPGFEAIQVGKALVPCVAFCNEEGKLKGLPVNIRFQAIWPEPWCNMDMVAGPVVILYGSISFMRAL